MVKKTTAKTKPWKFSADTSRPHDPLLNSLLILAKLHNRPVSAETLIAGLPLENHKLTPDTFKRAAMRAGLGASLIKGKLTGIVKKTLPAVLFLQQGKVCILQSINSFIPEQVCISYGRNQVRPKL